MAIVLAAAITTLGTVLVAAIGVRRPMKKEHATTAHVLGRIEGTLDGLVDQASDTEHKIDEHIADHARHEFD